MLNLFFKLILVFLFFFIIENKIAVAAPEEQIREDYITGHLSTGYFPIKKFQPSEKPRFLSNKILNDNDKRTAEIAKNIFMKSDNNLSLLLLDKEKIILEIYKEGLSEKNKFFSYSMSKSLTSYTVGYALCNGFINNLNDKAKNYSDLLKDNVFGDASIQQLLMMRSGANPPDQEGGSLNGEWREITTGSTSISEILNKYGSTKILPEKFSYNNSNTNALMLAVDGKINFADFFEKSIWKKINAESESTWLIDRDKKIYAAAGFGASLKDWGKIAIHSIKMRNGSEGQCISKFAQEAANGKIKIDELKHKNLNYGYQIWDWQTQLENKIYMWLGAYGQRVMVDPKNEKILILFRNKNDHSTSELISKFFLVWSQTN